MSTGSPRTARTVRRLAGGLAVAALSAVGMLGAAPAMAADAEAAPTSTLPTAGPAFDARAKDLLALPGVVSVSRDGDDDVVVLTEKDAPAATSAAVADLRERYGNVVIGVSAPYVARAATDLVGGAGYLIQDAGGTASACSVGFTAWTPTGGPAVLSAGHCAAGALPTTKLTVPSRDTAAGGGIPAVLSDLGSVAFSQFGGPGDTAGADQDASSVDIAAIDVTNPALTLRPAVTDWTGGASDDLAASTIPVTALAEPTLGEDVAKSGRTTGYTTGGTVASIGWADVSGHFVHGFLADGLVSGAGDSGGAVIAGTTAVGLVSGGPDDGSAVTWVANLADALPLTGGYTLRLALDAPRITSVAPSAEVVRGTRIAGTATPGSTVQVVGDAGFTATATAGPDGAWSFATPLTTGPFSFTATERSGFNVSPPTAFQVVLTAAPLAAPVVTSPAPGSSVPAVTALAGTANPGYTVTVSGDAAGTAVAGADGRWSIPVTLGAGRYSVTVTQAFGGETSEGVVVGFVVVGVGVPDVPDAPDVPDVPATPVAPVTPVAPAAPAAAAPSPATAVTLGETTRLADTGMDASPLLAGAVALALLVGALMAGRRRARV